MKLYQAYVDNIGYIGDYTSKQAAIGAVKQTIAASGRADPHGFVLNSSGNLVAEIGDQPNEEGQS